MEILEPPRERLNTEEMISKSRGGGHEENNSNTHKHTVLSISSNKEEVKPPSGSENGTGHSILNFIYDDVTQRVKNIEDFGAPVGQINRILHSILTQIRVNLNEPEHPINIIVTKFQKILLDNV